MAKRNQPNPGDQSKAVYDRTISLTRSLGRTQNLDAVNIPTHNVTTLESHIQREQIVMDEHYDWQKGKVVCEPKDVLHKAQSHISTLTLRHPATSGIRRDREQEECKLETGNRNGGNDCCAPTYYGHPGSPVPTVPLSGGMKRKREN